MRTRRRAKYTWFPNIGFQGADEEDDFAGFPFSVGVPAVANTLGDANIFELIPDFTADEPTATTDNLSDFIGNEYVLKRVVGKLFASYNTQNAAGFALLGVGLFIARSDATAPQLPVGAGTATERKLNYGVLNNQNIREPWLFRRVWQLTNAGIASQTLLGPASTSGHGSVMDGPHIDAKSARRVRKDERLFVCVQAGNPGAAVGAAGSIDGFMDYRVLGALRKAKSRSAF